MSDTTPVDLNTDTPERVDKETIDLAADAPGRVKEGFEVSIAAQEYSKSAPQLDTLVPSIENPKTV